MNSSTKHLNRLYVSTVAQGDRMQPNGTTANHLQTLMVAHKPCCPIQKLIGNDLDGKQS